MPLTWRNGRAWALCLSLGPSLQVFHGDGPALVLMWDLAGLVFLSRFVVPFREGIEDTVLSKRAFVYEEELHKNPLNYDCWIDYIRLEENRGDIDKIRNTYERALANVPPVLEKRCWKR